MLTQRISTAKIRSIFCIVALIVITSGCKRPKEDIVLRQIKDIVVDATTEPMLKANAIFFNPNNLRGRLKRINIDIYVNGKKSASVNQELKTIIPANDEFSVPLEVKLNMKELGFMDTLLGMIGGKKFEVQYQGSLKLTYHGFPVRVPVNYKDDIRVRF